MAKQLNVNLAMTADTGKARAELLALLKQLDNLMLTAQKSSGKMSLSLDIQKATALAALLKVLLESATSSTGNLNLTKFNNELRASKTSIDDYKNALTALGPAGTLAFSNLATSIMKAEVPLRRSNTMLANFATTLKNTARWQISSSILHGFMGALQGAYGYAQDLNESLNNIRIVTGQSVEQMARFAELANRAAKELSTTTTAYTDAALIYYQLGLTGKDVTDRTNVTIKLANVSRQAAEDVSSQMTAIWNNFADGSKSLEYYADVITKLGASTASSSDEIAQGLQKFASVADTVGLSYEKATAALATVVAETRQSADVVGTAFKTMFARFQGLSLGETLEDGVDLNKYSKALATIGVNILDANGELKVMDDILDETAEKWNQISEAQRVALAETVAGTRQYAQFMAIMNNYGKIQANQALAEGSEGTLQLLADIYAESWEAASKRVKAAAQDIYNDLLDDKFFIKLLNGFEKVLNVVDNFIEGIGGVGPLLTLIGSIVTQVFGNLISAAIRNTINDIHTLTAKGLAEINVIRLLAREGLLLIATSLMNTGEGQGVEAALKAQAGLLDVIDQKAAHLSEQLLKLVLSLLDINRLLGEEAIAAGRALDQEKLHTVELQKQISRRSVSQSDNILQVLRVKIQQDNLTKAYQQNTLAYDMYAKKLNLPIKTEELFKALEADIREMTKLFAHSKSGSEDFLQTIQALYRAMNSGDIPAAIENFNILQQYLDIGVTPSTLRLEAALEACNIPHEEAARLAQLLANQLEKERVAADNASDANRNVGNSVLQLSKIIAGMQAPMDLVSTGITKLSSIFMSLNTAINAIKNIGNIISDDSLSSGEKAILIFSALAMILPLITTLVNKSTVSWATNLVAVIANNTAHSTGVVAKLAHKVATLALKTATDELTISMLASLGVIGLIIAAVGALVFAIIKLVGWLKKISISSYELEIKQITSETEKLNEELDETRLVAKDLRSEFDSYKDIVDKLNNCTKGTTEWKEALLKAIEKTDELLQKYPLLANMMGALNPDGTLNMEVFKSFMGQETSKEQALFYAQIGQAGRTAQANKYLAPSQTASNYYENDGAYGKLASDYYSGLTGLGGVLFIDFNQIKQLLEQGGTTIDEVLELMGEEGRAQYEEFAEIRASTDKLVEEINGAAAGFLNMLNVADVLSNRIDLAVLTAANNLALRYAFNNKIEANATQLFYGGKRGQAAYNETIGHYDADFMTEAKKSGTELSKKLSADYLTKVRGYSQNEAEQMMIDVDKEGNYTIKNVYGDIIDTLSAESMKLAIAGLAAGEAVLLGFNKVTEKFKNLSPKALGIANTISESAMRNGGIANMTDVLGSMSVNAIKQMNENTLSFDENGVGQVSADLLKTLGLTIDEFNKLAEVAGMSGTELVQSLLDTSSGIQEAIGKGIFDGLPEALSSLSFDLAKEISNAFKSADLREELNSIYEALPTDVLKNGFIEKLGEVDFSDWDSIEDFKQYLMDLGIEFKDTDIDEFTKKLEISNRAIRNVDVDGLAEKFGKIQKIIDKITVGGEISQKDYEELSSTSRNFFRLNADDSYTMVGNVDDAKHAINTERRNEISLNINYTNTNLNAALTAIASTSALDIEGLQNATEIMYLLQSALEELSFLYLSTADNLSELTYLYNDLTDLIDSSGMTYLAYGEVLIKLASNHENCADEIKDYLLALLSGDEALIKTAESALVLSAQTGELAKKYGLDTQKTENYSKRLAESFMELGMSQEAAAKLSVQAAIANLRLDRGLLSLNKNINTYKKNLKEANKGSAEWSETMDSLKADLADVLNVDVSTLTDDFGETALESEDLQLALDGNVDAILRLQTAAAELMILSIQTNLEGADLELFTSQWDYLKTNMAEAIQSPGVDQTALIESFNSMIEAGNMTKEQIETALAGLHVSADVHTEYVPQRISVPTTITEEHLEPMGSLPYTVIDDAIKGTTKLINLPMYRKYTNTYDGAPVEVDGYVPKYTIEGTKGAGGITTGFASAPTPHASKGATKSGGTGGGGGGTKHSAEASNPTEHRYSRVENAVEGISNQYDVLAKARERAWGADKLSIMDSEIAKLKQLKNAYGDYLKEIAGADWEKLFKKILAGGALELSDITDGYLAKDYGLLVNGSGDIFYTRKDAAGKEYRTSFQTGDLEHITGVKAQLGSNGKLANKDEILAGLEAYKFNMDTWWNDEANQENEDDIARKTRIGLLILHFEDAISQYDETVDKFYEQTDNFQDVLYQIQDLNFEKWQTELDLKVDLNESQLKRLETAARILGDSVYKTVEVMKNLFSADHKIDSQYSTFLNRGKEYEEAYKNAQALYDAEKISQDLFILAVQTARDGIYEVIDSLLDMNEKMRQFYSDTIDGAVEELRKLTDLMAHHVEIMEHLKNLLSLTGQEFDYESMETVLKATVEMERNALEESTAEYKMFQELADNARKTYQELLNNPAVSEEAAREFKEAVLDPAIAQAREAENKMYEDAEAYLESVVELYKNTLDKIMAAREDALTKGLGWDFLANSMERAKAVQEEYLTKTNLIYETNTLLRKLAQDIDKTDSVAAKTKLKNFSTEIEQMQKLEKLNLSDLDIAKARYELLLAQIALEEAQNAKSIVRLQRDSEGNYGYVYTADLDKIDDAELNFADKQNDLYNLVLGQANDYGEKITQIEREKYEALQQLALDYQEGRITTLAEFDEKYLLTAAYYDDLLEALRHSYYTALGWLDEVATTDHTEAWTTAYKDVIDAGENYRQDTIDTFTEIKSSMIDLDSARKEVTDNTSLGLNDLKEKTDTLKRANLQLKNELISNTIPTMGNLLTSVSEVTAEWALQYDQIMAMIRAYMQLAAAMDMAERDAATLYDFSNVSDFSQEMANEYAANGFSARYNALARTRNSKGTTGYLSNDELSLIFLTALQKGINLSGKYFTRELYNEIVGMASGGYTGEWGSDGKLAILHEKELVLGAEDTANILATIELVRLISSAIDLRAAASSISTGLNSPSFGGLDLTLEQEVTIHAEFPNATDHTEIEEAFNNLINRATQYAARPSSITYKTPRV